MKKLFSAVLALCASLLFFGLLFTGCSYFDFAGGGTVVEKETVYETIYETVYVEVEKEVEVEVPVEVPVDVLTACTCWANADGVASDDEMTNSEHYSVTVLQEHFAKADGSIVDGSYLIKCKKCTWSCRYEGALHRDFITVVEGDCKDGAFERVRCKACNIIKSEKTTTVAHTEKVINTKNPTCTQQGEKTYECTVCKAQRQEAIKATGHPATKTTLDVEVGTTLCEDGGYNVTTCTVCHEVVSKTPAKATGHSILMAKVDNDPTITEDMIGWASVKTPSDTEKGAVSGFCVQCRQMTETSLPAWNSTNYHNDIDCKNSIITYTIFVDNSGKTYAEKPANVVVNTFTFKNENAKTYHTLNGVLMSKDRYPASLKGITELAEQHATCALDGSGYFICENEQCQQSIYITTYVEHSFDGAKVIPYDGQEPTCIKAGSGYSLCLNCGVARKENISINKISHSYKNTPYEPTVTYNPTTKSWTTILKLACDNCDYVKEEKSKITITSSKAPTCSTSGWATITYTDYNGTKVTTTVIIYDVETNTTTEGYGHSGSPIEKWTWVDEKGNTHDYTGFTCKYCGIRFIQKEVIKDKNGIIINTIVYPIPTEDEHNS